MLTTILRKTIGTRNDRILKKMWRVVEEVNALKFEMLHLSDEALSRKTEEFRDRLKRGETLDDLLVEAFACAREAGRRTIEMRHFDVQIIGGMVLHEGKIAEMATGEGKTLVATLAAYLNALKGRSVHVITVNDYLARRDTEWMGPIYRALGLTVGCIQHDMDNPERKTAYACDVTYGTNNEFGFDYLRDNMKYAVEDMVQRGHHFAVVDEVDSILIDEARTPLIISGPSEESTELYYRVNDIARRLKRQTHYEVKEEDHVAMLTEAGVREAEKLLGAGNIYDPANMDVLHHLNQSVRAYGLYKRDVDYVVKEGKVVIVDEFTGRMMPGRRWSDGLHQAVEAREGVNIESENQTIATITFQNYFRMYEKLSGMTGTAATEAEEFEKIYSLEVVTIPTNKYLRRTHNPDVVYRTKKEKFKAVAEEIEELHKKGQPVLVGTVSIETSEHLSGRLKRSGIPHRVLNAKYHEKEATIVAQAGGKAAVTIATNMAGRGTDILLGGNPEFLAKAEADPEKESEKYQAALEKHRATFEREHQEVVDVGGLHVLGTERHESRRVDNQLRGRAGRQGDPGSTRFYLSLEDDLMRIFGSDRVSAILQKLGMQEGEPIEHKMVTNAIERAQKKVEARNFDMRKHLLEYDDVMNAQRKAVYAMRIGALKGDDQSEFVLELARGMFDGILDIHLPQEVDPSEWDADGFEKSLRQQLGLRISGRRWADEEKLSRPEIEERAWKFLEETYREKHERLGDAFRDHEKLVILHFVDMAWKDHLLAMDHLKEGIGLRGYGQRDPLIEYKKEAFNLFQDMQENVREKIVRYIFLLEPSGGERRAAPSSTRRPVYKETEYVYTASGGGDTASSSAYGEAASPQEAKPKPYRSKSPKVGRNEPCPCGSGKKFKKCCAAKAAAGAGV
jgi:preprotein translocase subunit SecA